MTLRDLLEVTDARLDLEVGVGEHDVQFNRNNALHVEAFGDYKIAMVTPSYDGKTLCVDLEVRLVKG